MVYPYFLTLDKLKKISTVVHKPFACDQCPETFPASRFAETNYIKHYRLIFMRLM